MSAPADPTMPPVPSPNRGTPPAAPPRQRLRRLAPAAIATTLAFAVLVGLGFWQVERMGSKERLLARIEAGLAAEPRSLPPEAEWSHWPTKAYDYAKVRVTGTFRHDREIHLQGLLTLDAKGPVPPQTLLGFYILTPLTLPDGATLLVNRGFVPQEKVDPATRKEGQVEGVQTVTGLLRAPQPQGWFVPDDEPGRNIWFTRDASRMAAALRLARVAPFTLDADSTPVPGGLPAGGKTIIAFPNNHLQYAATWFALAAGLVGVFLAWARQQVKAPSEPTG